MAMGRRALLAGIVILTLLSGGGTVTAMPLHEADPTLSALAASACAPNPAPAPRGQRTVNVSTPSSGQSVSSAIVVRGTANPGSSFRVVLYGDDGRELAARNMGPIDGDAFVVAVPYRTEREQEGCLWLFNTTGPNWSGNPINVIQVRVLLRATIGECYPEAGGICIDDHFQRFWSGNGGLYQFGFPIAAAQLERDVSGQEFLVQYFERARFEYHPEQAGTKYDVLLGLLGNELTVARRAAGDAAFLARPRPDGCGAEATDCQAGGTRWFAATGHLLGQGAGESNADAALAGIAIAEQWANRGGLTVYGYPISEVLSEQGYDGRTYFVQYFERHRLEYHPENAAPYTIQLAQLGRQIYEARYGTK
jgi:hypothetical protein